MSDRTTFTDAEWNLLRTTPALVGSGVAAADPSGIFASMKEAAGSAMGLGAALREGKNVPLFAALAADRSLPDMPDRHTFLGEGPREAQLAHLKASVLERVGEAMALLKAKATAEEHDAYRQMLMQVADRAANAAKEGSFLGFGGVRVSEKEQAFLAEVEQATRTA